MQHVGNLLYIALFTYCGVHRWWIGCSEAEQRKAVVSLCFIIHGMDRLQIEFLGFWMQGLDGVAKGGSAMTETGEKPE